MIKRPHKFRERVLDTPSQGPSGSGGYVGGCAEVHEYGEWHPHVYRDDTKMVVYASNYCTNDWSFCRRMGHHKYRTSWNLQNPSISRLERTLRSCRKWCEKKNGQIEQAKSVEEILKDNYA